MTTPTRLVCLGFVCFVCAGCALVRLGFVPVVPSCVTALACALSSQRYSDIYGDMKFSNGIVIQKQTFGFFTITLMLNSQRSQRLRSRIQRSQCRLV